MSYFQFGIENSESTLFRDYFDHRQQYVHVEIANSKYLEVNCCVLQESILGSLLFIIYANDLPHFLNNYKVILYADVTLIMFPYQDPIEIKSHCKKTCLMSVSSSNFILM